MRTVTIDILNDKAIDILKDLEAKNMIKIYGTIEPINTFSKYSGAMTKQPIEEIDKQLKELREEWNRKF